MAQAIGEHVLSRWRDIRMNLREWDTSTLLCGYETDFEAHSRSGGHGNPTQSRAIRRADNDRMAGDQRRHRAIEQALLKLGGRHGKDSPVTWAMQAHYLHGWTWTRICEKLEVSRQTTWRWLQMFRVYVWEGLGRRL